MEVRLTVKTTPGRPVRAILVMAALTVLAGLLAWALTVYKQNRAEPLSGPVELPGLRIGISVPADWSGLPVDDPDTGQVAMFYDPSMRPGAGRGLAVFRLEGRPAGPGDLFADFGELRQVRERRTLDPRRIGPLPARQMVVTTVLPNQVRTHILRAAVLGHDSYLLLQLDCLGPPTPWEERLMDRLARTVTLDPAAYPDPARVAGQVGIDLADRSADWLISPFADQSADLTLLPRAGEDGDPAFWGQLHLTVLTVRPDEDLARRLAAELAAGAPRGLLALLGEGPAPSRAAGRLAEQAVRQQSIGLVTAWTVRGEDRGVIRLACIFRATGPGEAPSPNRAVLFTAWTAAEDEAAAAQAVEALVQSVRLR